MSERDDDFRARPGRVGNRGGARLPKADAGDFEVVDHRQVAEEPPALEGPGDAATAHLVRLQARKRLPFQ